MKLSKLKVFLISTIFATSFFVACSVNEDSNIKEEKTSLLDKDSTFNKPAPDDDDAQVPGPMCLRTQISDVTLDKDVKLNKDASIEYAIRDKFLKKYNKGKRYVREYYSISKIEKDYSKFSISSFINIAELLPSIYSAYNNLENKDFDGVIVDEDLKEKLVLVLNEYKKLSTDDNYNTIINKLLEDVDHVKGMNKNELIEFMESE